MSLTFTNLSMITNEEGLSAIYVHDVSGVSEGG